MVLQTATTASVIVICLLVACLCGSSVNAREGAYPSDQQIQAWKDQISEENISVIYSVADKLYGLPREPWSEPLRVILLNLIERHTAIREALQRGQELNWGDPKFKKVWLGEYAGNLVEMATWQADRRFILFLGEHIGGGMLAARGLAAIGEPAFDMVIQKLRRDGWSSQQGAAKALELMLKADLPFLRAGGKRDHARESLLRVARSKYDFSRMSSIDALRYFNDKAVFALLDSLSQHDMYTIDGRYPVRKRAQEAMQFIRSQGDDRQ